MSKELFENKLIEVCDECLTASCWHGEHMCDKSKEAGTVLKTVTELVPLGLESTRHWNDLNLERIYGNKAPHGWRE